MNNIQEFLEKLDILFDKNNMITFDKTDFPLLLKIFEKFREDLDIPTKNYLKLKNTKSSLLEALQSSFDDTQKKLFEDYWEIENKMKTLSEEEIFLFGYFIRDSLEKENLMSPFQKP